MMLDNVSSDLEEVLPIVLLRKLTNPSYRTRKTKKKVSQNVKLPLPLRLLRFVSVNRPSPVLLPKLRSRRGCERPRSRLRGRGGKEDVQKRRGEGGRRKQRQGEWTDFSKSGG